jgi:hypothetical protein
VKPRRPPLTTGSFTVACPDGVGIDAAASYDAATRTATLTPAFPLPADVTCIATVASSATDDKGVALGTNFTWSFDTTVDAAVVDEGKQTFRFDTFGDESFWTDKLRRYHLRFVPTRRSTTRSHRASARGSTAGRIGT